MISKLANEVYEGWRCEGLAPSLEMCVDLNAAGLEMECNTRFCQVTGKCRAREEVRAMTASSAISRAAASAMSSAPPMETAPSSLDLAFVGLIEEMV